MVNPVLDLRSNTKIGVANDPSPGIGLFNDGGNLVVGPWLWNAAGVDVAHWRAPVDVSGLGYTNLGSDPYATMSVANRTALAVTLGVNPGRLPNSNLADILAHFILGTLADPTGVTGVKPLRMGKNGLRLHLGTSFADLTEELNFNHPNFEATLAVRFADYHRMAVAGVSQDVLEKWTGYDMLKFGESINPNLLTKYIPIEYLNGTLGTHGAQRPTTTINDTFTRVDADALGLSSDGDWSWAEVTGDADIVSNAAARGSANGFHRAEKDLSSDAQYSEADVISWGAGENLGVLTRFAGAATTCMEGLSKNAATATWRIFKVEANVRTALASANGDQPAVSFTHRLTSDSADLHTYTVAAVDRTFITDTSITANLRAGLSFDDGAGQSQDNFEAADLAVGGFVHSQIVVVS